MPVHFNEERNTILCMVTYSFAYRAARRGPWEMYARDRERFHRKIKQYAIVLDKILDPKHRQNVFVQRF